jgi:hypothetical protein
MTRKYYSSVFIIAAIFFLLFPPGCSSRDYSVMLTWDVPTTCTDGTPLTDLAGYELLMGTSPNNYSRAINIPVGDGLLSCKDASDNKNSSKKATKCSYTVTGLPQGDYYFVISAYNTYGNKSASSNEVKKTAALSMEKK